MHWKQDSVLREQAGRGWEPRENCIRRGFSASAPEVEYRNSLNSMTLDDAKAECVKLFNEIIMMLGSDADKAVELAMQGADADYSRRA